MDDPRGGASANGEVPLLQRLYDRPFLLLAGDTLWGLWEVMSLPDATLP